MNYRFSTSFFRAVGLILVIIVAGTSTVSISSAPVQDLTVEGSQIASVPLPSGWERVSLTASPTDINDRGVMVGTLYLSTDDDDELWPVRWDKKLNQQIVTARQGTAIAVNARGGIAVTYYNPEPNGFEGALLWKGKEWMIDRLDSEPLLVTDLNDSNEVVGVSYGPTFFRGFLWSRRFGTVDMGNLGGDRIFPRAINNTGEVVGDGKRADGVLTAFHWTRSAGFVDLGVALQSVSSRALGVNNFGTVVGCYARADAVHPFAWRADTGVTDLPVGGCALDINDGGFVVGIRSILGGTDAALWIWSQETGVKDIDTLCDDHGGCSYALQMRLNSKREIVGERLEASGDYTGTLWRPSKD